MAMYDTIAQKYRMVVCASNHRPDQYTFSQFIGQITGKSILELGCGEGYYTRQLKQLGAKQVVGVDISPEMLALARAAEADAHNAIEYITADVRTVGQVGEFDMVVAFFLLNHAQTAADLQQMCNTIALNLKPHGRFFAINNNLDLPPEAYPRLEPYGRQQQVPPPFAQGVPLVEGTPITVTMSLANGSCTFTDYYLSKSTYENALQHAGIGAITWHKTLVPPEYLQAFGQEFFHDYLAYPWSVVIEGIKHSTTV